MVAKEDNTLMDTVKQRMKHENVNPRQLSKLTGIPVDRIYKWMNKGFQPKANDAEILRAWLSSNITEDVPHEKSPGDRDFKEKYYQQLEKNTHLEEKVDHVQVSLVEMGKNMMDLATRILVGQEEIARQFAEALNKIHSTPPSLSGHSGKSGRHVQKGKDT
jgi:predicted DNA-binding transcriptional regulator AlpA